jgi:hypothetical protein
MKNQALVTLCGICNHVCTQRLKSNLHQKIETQCSSKSKKKTKNQKLNWAKKIQIEKQSPN